MFPEARDGGFNLIFDADDTLWDSNVHFYEAQAAFVELLRGVGVDDHREVHAAIRTHELTIIQEVGYGRRPYLMALHRVVEQIVESAHHEALRPAVDAIGFKLLNCHCELLPGVAATLAELSARHRLLLFTKGQPEEQLGKLERSGLSALFSRVGVPLEKDSAAYERLLAQAELDPTRTVMIGNSPRSDINPAIRAGLRAAIYIPHPQTWELEHEELLVDERVMVVTSFPELRQLF
jgi:putative hydrolase of the HAD superfamily